MVNIVLYVFDHRHDDRIWIVVSKKAAKNINNLYGYRTRMSMKNEKTWVFAHQYAGRIWFYSGIAGLCFSVITLFCFRHSSCFETVSAILMIAQLILLIGVIWPTERALRRTFDSFGNLKK